VLKFVYEEQRKKRKGKNSQTREKIIKETEKEKGKGNTQANKK
jgi:hypothetical protein